MKGAYPVILTPTNAGYLVYVPDLEINTEGTDITNAIEMAEDAIGIYGISMQDIQQKIPAPSSVLPTCSPDQITTFVVVDFDAYRRAHDMRTIRKNVTLPSWLNSLAEDAGVNFSQVLQDALKRKLHVGSPS